MLAAAAADMDPQFAAERCQTALQRADDAGGYARGMPVHPHDGAERLEPEGMSETPQQLVAPVVMDNGLADHCAEAGHPVRQPFRHTPAVQRKIGGAGPASHRWLWGGRMRRRILPRFLISVRGEWQLQLDP